MHLLDGFWMRTGHCKDQDVVRSLEFSAPFSGEWSETKNAVNDISCPCGEDFIKSQKYKV